MYKDVWIRGFLKELSILEKILEEGYLKTILPFKTIFANNQWTVKLTENSKYYQKTKHISIKYHKIQKLVAKGVVYFKWISTNKMVANNLTKPLGICKFKKFVKMLGMVDC